MIEILDIGVIMGSTSLPIFEDMVERYPGANYFYRDFKSRCSCEDPDCARRAMQSNIEHLFDQDKERCALFFQKLAEVDQQPSDEQIRAILVGMGLIVGTGREEDIVEARLREMGLEYHRTLQ
jgi:hypothetical protein